MVSSATTASGVPSPSRSRSARFILGASPWTPSRSGVAQSPTRTVGTGTVAECGFSGGRLRPPHAASITASSIHVLQDIAPLAHRGRQSLRELLETSAPERGVREALRFLHAGLIEWVHAIEWTGVGSRALEKHEQRAERGRI